MKWRITFEIELPTDNYQDAYDWARFEIGFNSNLSNANPCIGLDLPAHWDALADRSLKVTRV
jgi:hypothetical protein